MQQENNEAEETTLADSISGTVQKIIGDIEMVGGVLTADPVTRAEGEFNAEVGEIREELEEREDDAKS